MVKQQDTCSMKTVSLRIESKTWQGYKVFCKDRGFTATKRIRLLILEDIKSDILDEKERNTYRIEILESQVRTLESKAFSIPNPFAD